VQARHPRRRAPPVNCPTWLRREPGRDLNVRAPIARRAFSTPSSQLT
jgi:hypothetical protein